jgi:hypothetical protein
VKAMICEMCGSNNIAKEQGEYVCRSCGCKYSAEDAKKLLVEVDGPIEVKGVSTVENDLIRGDQCLDVQDWESALGIFASAIAKDATCFQAWYGCLRAMSKDFQAYRPVSGDTTCRISLTAAIQNSLKFADDENLTTVLNKIVKWEVKLQTNNKRDQENEQKLSELQSKRSVFRTLIFLVGVVDCILVILHPLEWVIWGLGFVIILVLSFSIPKNELINQMMQTSQNAIDYTDTLSALSKGMQGYRNPK